MKQNPTVPDVDARLTDLLDRLARALDAIACAVPDLGPARRARLAEALEPIADDLHAVGVTGGSVADDHPEATPRLWRPG